VVFDLMGIPGPGGATFSAFRNLAMIPAPTSPRTWMNSGPGRGCRCASHDVSGASVSQLESSLPDVSWPAIPSGPAAQLLNIYHQLEATQWLPHEELLVEQFRQLGKLIAHARSTVPSYADRLSAIDDHPDPESWRKVPVLSRAELQAIGDSLLSTTSPTGHGDLIRMSSSGSSGTPITVTKTGLQQLVWNAITIRDLVWHNRPFSGRLAAIRRFPDRKATSYPDGADRARCWTSVPVSPTNWTGCSDESPTTC
jgi:hypothetical protein